MPRSRNHKRMSLPVAALALLTATALIGVAARGFATVLGKGNPKTECYLVFDGVTAPAGSNRVSCVDGDPDCDHDGACNDSCQFQIQACINRPGVAGCTPPAALKKLKTKPRLTPPASLTGSACGALTDVTVAISAKAKRKGKPGKARIRATAAALPPAKPKLERESLFLECQARPEGQACPMATTTTTTTPGGSTTTTIPPECCTQGFTQLTFATTPGAGNCGSVLNTSGSSIASLACGGLYFGGGQDSVPLPAVVPDTSQSIVAITACDSGTGNLTLGPRTAAQTGSPLNCTATGCLFGAPLPIPNANSAPTSTCVINSVSADAAGTATCGTGESQLALPLNSQIYLTGDLLADAGIQPCPLCTGGTCKGGPNDSQPCTPGSTALNAAYPTSHDCPPPPGADIGGLPIGFNLTTGSTTRTAVALGTQQRVFCGFCRDQNALGTGLFENPARPCTSNAECTDVNFPDCEQRNNGAFGAPSGGSAKTITMTGSPAGNMSDGQLHASTLVSIFCIPPTFNATVDNAADLAGPGAVALQGQSQLLP
jgi:hypothetical protein